MTVEAQQLKDVSPNQLGQALLSIYPESVLSEWFKKFAWGSCSHEESVKTRQELVDIGQALSNNEDHVVNFFNTVKRWGFNNQEIDSDLRGDADFRSSCLSLFEAWRGESNTKKIETMGNLMSFPGMGIANVSKFTAMTDPVFGAIYDSRVSIALRPITYKDKVFFPTVGRRKTLSKPHYNASVMTQKQNRFKLAERYLLFLQMLSHVCSQTGFARNSDIEMSLFMIGD